MSGGWTIVEVLTVIAILAMLSSVLVPSLVHARDQARVVACAAQLHGLHQALMCYTAAGNRRLPPFRFASLTDPSLPAAGHWGGTSQAGDPVLCGTKLDSGQTAVTVNLWKLVELDYVEAGALTCPGAAGEFSDGQSSMFPYSSKFSTYCMRFPYSWDVFRSEPSLARYFGGNLLDVYRAYNGGQRVQLSGADSPGRGGSSARVPLLRIDRSYRIAPEVASEVQWGDGVYDVASDVMLADGFWWRDKQRPAGQPMPGLDSYQVRSGWYHGRRFNTLSGDGAVTTVADDPQRRPIETNSLASGQTPAGAGPCDAVAAERVWQFFDVGGRLN